jgi:hypothetical protein
MLTDTSHVSDEVAVGVRVAHLELGWDNYEPQDGVFSSAYASQARQRLDAFRAAGMKVVLGLGLQYPPSWVYGYPGSRYMNQYGRSADPVNLTFNQTLRARSRRPRPGQLLGRPRGIGRRRRDALSGGVGRDVRERLLGL